ncbi:hypothetical protein GCM10010392_66020 [Streptomyces clavifer]|uniref:IS30 family transposase n=1 Tax=Streptomyces clavifer TaxID=68188 RepID=A0ABS4VHX5_9ACTN|nr:IS30 family transposase [Streptomyces clavifer]GHB28674.1 hypothetical protein GCM10010392_66020 [Streptomyces clavifer]
MNPCLAPTVSGRYLSFAEREEIALLRARDFGVRAIARCLGRSPSTISRELRRNASTRSYHLEYRASLAQWHAERRAQRPKPAKLVADERLREYVQDRLAGNVVHALDGRVVEGPQVPPWQGRSKPRRQDRRWATSWSPEQISQRLTVDFPEDESMRISPEAIYQALYVQGCGALKRELVACLRTGRSLRVPRERTRQSVRGHVTADVLISERPAEAEDRAVPGHWEGDLVIGTGRSAIGTLVERSTRFSMLLRLPRMEGFGTEPRTKNGPALAGRGGSVTVDIDGVLVLAHSEKQDATATWKKTFGHHPLVAFVDHGQAGSGEPVAALLRPGNADSNTASDHITTTGLALSQLPKHLRRHERPYLVLCRRELPVPVGVADLPRVLVPALPTVRSVLRPCERNTGEDPPSTGPHRPRHGRTAR